MEQLEKIFINTPAVDITDRDKLVIFSDLHMGDGGRMDDFLHNAPLFKHILENYYEKKNYKLTLNGDIDELQRFSLKKVTTRWQDLYKIFKRFHNGQSLFKTVGNHDLELSFIKRKPENIPIREALKLRYHKQFIFILHGHQAGNWIFKKIHWLIHIVLRIFANSLRIRNYTVAQNNRKKFKVEKRVYDFARKTKIMAIIGHTHRPLFESLSKKENLRFKIENLCREYPAANAAKKKVLEKRITKVKKALQEILHKKEEDLISNLYNSNLEPLIPCIFNSGSAIGKRGITSIEISHGNIRLIYWFDKNVPQKYFDLNGYELEQLEDSPYCRVVLKEESLNYMFTRIELLAD
ncbi:MAG TPA: metallophosphoesterase [Candidatus Deferrimicrobium sp.]|nr:metallophosphoesterase [Candidatus Deferrimicrobium sp.]